MLANAAVILTGMGGSTSRMAHTHAVGRRLFSLGGPECPPNMAPGFPQRATQERDERGSNAFYGLVLEVTCCHFCHDLFVKIRKLVQPTFKGKGISLHLLKGRISNTLWRYFKTTTEGLLIHKY